MKKIIPVLFVIPFLIANSAGAGVVSSARASEAPSEAQLGNDPNEQSQE